jgi:hypothetical protein
MLGVTGMAGAQKIVEEAVLHPVPSGVIDDSTMPVLSQPR